MTSKHADGKTDGDPKLMGTGKGLKAILGGLEELWDQSQYTEEYNLTQFLAKLNGWTAVTDTVYKVYSFWVRKRNFDILMLVLFFPTFIFAIFLSPHSFFFLISPICVIDVGGWGKDGFSGWFKSLTQGISKCQPKTHQMGKRNCKVRILYIRLASFLF